MQAPSPAKPAGTVAEPFQPTKMRWRQIFIFDSLGTLLTMCAVILAWSIASTVVVGTLTLLFEGMSFRLYVIGTVLVVVPIIYAAGAAIAFFNRN
jgi:hypothetical protein